MKNQNIDPSEVRRFQRQRQPFLDSLLTTAAVVSFVLMPLTLFSLFSETNTLTNEIEALVPSAPEDADRFCDLNVVVCPGEEAPPLQPVVAAETDYLLQASCYLATGYRMSNGEWPYWGAVAVKRSDKRFAPGDRIWIDYFEQEFVVADTLPEEAEPDLDIYWNDRKACVQWGIREVHVRRL